MDQDLVIIGAPRSGTNMLRDILTGVPGFATWPCDEINMVWRHGNRGHPSDELRSGHASPAVRTYVRRQFDKIRRKSGAEVVVEKTCANSLRVPFVRRCLPNARFLFITRDGVDAAASAVSRWDAPLDVRYTAAKARFVPPTDLPYYGARFIAARLRPDQGDGRSEPAVSRRGAANVPVRWWGPQTEDWRELATGRPLGEICMIQWQRCVEASMKALSQLPTEQVLHLSYEAFVAQPQAGLRDILTFIGRPGAFDPGAVASVSTTSVGKGRERLSVAERARLVALGSKTLRALGYDT